VADEVEHVVDAIREDAHPTGSLSNAPVHLADAAGDIVADVEVLATEHNILAAVNGALDRIEDGTFGACQQCGQKISEERLKAIPYAALCIECARKSES
jgi:RNA polymerase-binding transcription factor DksA